LAEQAFISKISIISHLKWALTGYINHERKAVLFLRRNIIQTVVITGNGTKK